MKAGVLDKKNNRLSIVIRTIRISEEERKRKRKEILKVLIKEENA